MTQPVQAIVPDTERYRSPEAETALVYPLRDHDYHDPIMRMLRSALEESWDVFFLSRGSGVHWSVVKFWTCWRGLNTLI